MSLWGLWELSIGLTACSLLIMVCLVVARLVSERKAALLSEQRRAILPSLLDGKIETIAFKRSIRRDPQVTDLLVEFIGMVRGEEREQFVALASRAGVANELVRRLKSGSMRTRINAAEALTHFTDDHATHALDVALDNRSPEVRLTAALALGASGRSPPMKMLVERLSLGRSENSLLLITLLERLVDESPLEIEALLEDPDIPAGVKAAAIDALAATRRFHVAPAINRLALETSSVQEELARYLRALGALGHPAGIPAVSKSLEATTWWVRAAAAEAAGKIGISEAIPRLSTMLGDEDWWVRFRAGEALSLMGRDGVDALRTTSLSDAEPGRSAARLTLAELGISQDG